MLKTQEKRYRRHQGVRKKIYGTAKRPRLCVFRSIKHIYAQLIDDEKGMTLVSANDLEIKTKNKKSKTKIKKKKNKEVQKLLTRKVSIAWQVGKLIAKKALAKKIGRVVFDKGGYAFHGRVKALAEGAREGGLIF